MRIVVSGSSGLIGSALVAELGQAGHSVSRLVRSRTARVTTERLILWDPESGAIDAAALEAHDAAVHLAGESIFGLWTGSKKRAIRNSRMRGTTLLSRTLAGLQQPPRVLISASAIGYYGNRPAGEPVTESGSRGGGFLAEVVERWEECTAPARAAGIRVANPRFGLILSRDGGALAVMLPVFQAGLGGKLGSGSQIWSWITLSDVVGGIVHVVSNDTLFGPINFTAPEAVSNEVFTRVLARVLNRPTFLHVPAFVMRLVGQQMAEELLLSGVRAVPGKLLDSGYRFLHAELEPALRAVVDRE
ncbi:MAG: TIGR01777 family oxidoreductase [Longimicrobiales bacterium]